MSMKKLPSIIRSSTSYKKKFKDIKLPIKITATNWAVLHGGKYVFGKQTTERKYIASLTKIMTAYTIIKFAEEHFIPLEREIVSVSKAAETVGGTTALLQESDQLSAWELLHGMMLPSGNDAAVALSEHFGYLIYVSRYGAKTRRPVSAERYFIYEMNKNAHMLHLFSTFFTNPHGMDQDYHKSCAYDVALLSYKAMKNSLFQRIVDCRRYEVNIINHRGNSRQLVWENTNLLLEFDGYYGIKTGVTPEAGPCLSVCYCKGKDDIIIVLLNCKSLERRWKEAKAIIKYCFKVLPFQKSKLRLPHLTW
jgi:D-alanyl-D-alanine carboxypeptidase